jgi:beta-phosphoglucomutase
MTHNKITEPPFAVLFDMDGVLINSTDASWHSREIMADKFGFTFEEVHSQSRRGGSLRDFYLKLQKLRPFDVDFDTFADAWLAANFAYLEQRIDGGDPATIHFIEDLRTHGIPFALGTSALSRSAKRKLALVELHDHFEIMVTAEDVERHKPHPDVYLEAARRVGVAPKQCIVIDDAEAGIESGKAAGMKAIGFSKYVENLETLAKADLVVNDFSELTYNKLLKLVKQ